MDDELLTTLYRTALFAVPVAFLLWRSGRKQKKKNAMRHLLALSLAKSDAEYKEALHLLSVEPSRANRIAALEAGRRLIELARNTGQTIPLDEDRLQNDLQAYGSD